MLAGLDLLRAMDIQSDREFIAVAPSRLGELRFDTRGDLPGVSGPRWKMAKADPRRFVARHPIGL